MQTENAYIFFWKGHFMYLGKGLETHVHDHHAIQIIIDLAGSFEVRLNNTDRHLFKAVLIQSDVHHHCISGSDPMIILNIAPESVLGKKLKQEYLKEAPVFNLEIPVTATYLKKLTAILKTTWTHPQIIQLTENYIAELAKTELAETLDDRIHKVLEILHQHAGNTLPIEALAEAVFISPSRLIHLFKQEVGVPIRKYILWLRLLKAISGLFKAKNITEAAMDAGFADAPHFNHTLKRMFGLSYTDLKNSQIVQAFWL